MTKKTINLGVTAAATPAKKRNEWGTLYIPAAAVVLFFILHQVILLTKTEVSGFAVLSNMIPFIYLMGIPYLLHGLLKRSRLALITGLLLTLIFTVQAVHINLKQPSPEGTTLTIMTHNLQVDHSDKSIVEERILSQQPDIVFLQEVLWDYKLNRLEAFAEENGYYLAEKKNYSLVILSKTPLTFVPSQSTPQNHIGYLFVETIIDDQELLLVNVHNPIPWFDKTTLPLLGFSIWWYTDDFRNHRMDQLTEDLSQYPDKTIIFGGDFNMNAYTVDYRKLTAYQDAYKTGGTGFGFTWPNARSEILRIPLTTPLFRLDYIFTSKDIIIHRAEKLASTGSDHLPLLVNLSLPIN